MSPFLVRDGFFGRETLGRVDLLWDGVARVDSGSYFTPRGDTGVCLVREVVQHTFIPVKCYLYRSGFYHDSKILQTFILCAPYQIDSNLDTCRKHVSEHLSCAVFDPVSVEA